MGDFRDRCNFLIFHFSEKLVQSNKVWVCRKPKRDYQRPANSLTLSDHLITSATLGSLITNFCLTHEFENPYQHKPFNHDNAWYAFAEYLEHIWSFVYICMFQTIYCLQTTKIGLFDISGGKNNDITDWICNVLQFEL